MGTYELLSPRRQTFVDGVLEGLTYAEAYRQAGYNSNYSDQNGSRLARTDAVRAAISQRREVAAKLIAWDRDRVTREWLANLELARAAGAHAPANTALAALVHHIGLDAPALPAAPSPNGITLTAKLSVEELRGVVEVLRLKEAGVVDVTGTVAMLAEGDAGSEGAGDDDAGGSG